MYPTEEERARRCGNTLSMHDVSDTLNADLAARASEHRFDVERLDDPAFKVALADVYPEAAPQGALPSVFESPP